MQAADGTESPQTATNGSETAAKSATPLVAWYGRGGYDEEMDTSLDTNSKPPLQDWFPLTAVVAAAGLNSEKMLHKRLKATKDDNRLVWHATGLYLQTLKKRGHVHPRSRQALMLSIAHVSSDSCQNWTLRCCLRRHSMRCERQRSSR